MEGNSKPKIQRIRFTECEKQNMNNYFRNHIQNKIAPKKDEVKKFMKKYKNMFMNKNWVKIKAYVYNCYRDKNP